MMIVIENEDLALAVKMFVLAKFDYAAKAVLFEAERDDNGQVGIKAIVKGETLVVSNEFYPAISNN